MKRRYVIVSTLLFISCRIGSLLSKRVLYHEVNWSEKLTGWTDLLIAVPFSLEKSSSIFGFTILELAEDRWGRCCCNCCFRLSMGSAGGAVSFAAVLAKGGDILLLLHSRELRIAQASEKFRHGLIRPRCGTLLRWKSNLVGIYSAVLGLALWEARRR